MVGSVHFARTAAKIAKAFKGRLNLTGPGGNHRATKLRPSGRTVASCLFHSIEMATMSPSGGDVGNDNSQNDRKPNH
jgi:hypothetical protein